jgi:molybdenum cofactor cytidylyltransferase
MAEIAVILLAAGESRRMGATNKLLLSVDGEPLVRRTARILVSLASARVTAVLGHDAKEVAAALSGLDVVLTINPDFAKGQRASVHHGIVHAGEADSYMVTPADLPRLTSADCGALIASHAAAPDRAVTVPIRCGQDGTERGNPIMLSGVARDEVIAGGINLGCRGLLDRCPDLVHAHTTLSDGFFVDIDTPEAYMVETGNSLPASAT